MKTYTTITREHSISCGHTVNGHEGKCAHLHGHNYKIVITVTSSGLDSIGRVIDFSVLKEILCGWLEAEWDHKFLIHDEDPRARRLQAIDPAGVVLVDFNPTAENMAAHLCWRFQMLLNCDERGAEIEVRAVRVEETDKCSAMHAVWAK
jgi:6-pyruvoyltetrahydropterin/6-carboxytetrahydropterin synthase